MRKPAELSRKPVKECAIHVAEGLFPAVSDTHAASQVAPCRRFDVHARQAVDVGPDFHSSATGDYLQPGSRFEAEFPGQSGRYRQAAVLVYFDRENPFARFGSLTLG